MVGMSDDARVEWRRELYKQVESLGFTNAQIGEAVGCTGANISHMIRRGARKSKLLPKLDQWLTENIEPLVGVQDPEEILGEIICDLRESIAQDRTRKNIRVAFRVCSLEDNLARIHNRLLRVRRRLGE